MTTEEFVLTWNASATPFEVAQKLAMPYAIVMSRASQYRKKGILLKKLLRKNARCVTVKAINDIMSKVNSFFVGTSSNDASPTIAQRALVLGHETARTPPPRGLSVRIHLLDGTADGLRIIERASSTIEALACPRPRFREVKGRAEFHRPGVYLLMGPREADGRERLYVGEGDPTLPRLEQHDCKKTFWAHLHLFTSKNDCLHKAHVQFLESRLTARAKVGGRYKLDNGNTPLPPSLSQADISDGEAFLDEVLLLSRLLGLSFFEPPRNHPLMGQETTDCRQEGIEAADSQSRG